VFAARSPSDLHIFYKSVVARAICFAAVSSGSSIGARDLNKLEKNGCRRLIIQRRMKQNLLIMDYDAQPLHKITIKQQSVLRQRLL